MIEIITKNAVDLINEAKDGIDAFIHGCNCFHFMGSGVAKDIKANFPLAYEADLRTIKGDTTKLGHFSIYSHDVSYADREDSYFGNLEIVNAYTQYHYGKLHKAFDYENFSQLCDKLDDRYYGLLVGMPWIGCGLGKADKNRIYEILYKHMSNCSIIICEL
jgi:O-acetyl-ADP-ribose deacetylase (regulator of RNase III)